MDLLLCAGCRDYIHIMDLAVGHVAALKQILNPDFTGIKVSVHKYGVRSQKVIWAPVYSCTHWLRLCNSPLPTAFGLIYEGAIGQPQIDDNLFVTPGFRVCLAIKVFFLS